MPFSKFDQLLVPDSCSDHVANHIVSLPSQPHWIMLHVLITDNVFMITFFSLTVCSLPIIAALMKSSFVCIFQ